MSRRAYKLVLAPTNSIMILNDFLLRAAKERWSTGHFNASELDHMRAIVEAAKEAGAPAIIGMSEGERAHIGLAEAVALRDVLREEYGIPVFLNADHTKHIDAAKAAVDAGFDSIHIDLSALPFDENLKGTKEIADYAHAKDPDISVEGELGYLRGESRVQKEKIKVSAEDYTNPEQAKEFAEKTGIDRLAVAVGNIHGISLDEPDLDIGRIRAIRAAVPQNIALVLHAASGIPDGKIQDAISAGISNIHINTDLRVAFTNELRKMLLEDADEVAMYKLDSSAIEAMKNIAKEKLALFGSVNKI